MSRFAITPLPRSHCCREFSQAEAQQKVRWGLCDGHLQRQHHAVADYAEKNGVDVWPRALSHYTNLQLALMTNQMDFVVMGYSTFGLMEDLGFKNYKGRSLSGVFTGAQSLTLRPDVTINSWKDHRGQENGSAQQLWWQDPVQDFRQDWEAPTSRRSTW